jgi:hypothetical protein
MPPSSEQITGFLQSIQRLLALIEQKKPLLGIAVRNDRPQRRYLGLVYEAGGDTSGKGLPSQGSASVLGMIREEQP